MRKLSISGELVMAGRVRVLVRVLVRVRVRVRVRVKRCHQKFTMGMGK
jgi:hypothetical protein